MNETVSGLWLTNDVKLNWGEQREQQRHRERKRKKKRRKQRKGERDADDGVVDPTEQQL